MRFRLLRIRLIAVVLPTLLVVFAATPSAEATSPAFIVFEYADGHRVAFRAGDPMKRVLLEIHNAERISPAAASFDSRSQAVMGLFWGYAWAELYRPGDDPTEIDPAEAEQQAILFLGTETDPPVIRVLNAVFWVKTRQLGEVLSSTTGSFDGDRPLSALAERILNDHGIQTRVGVPVALPGTGSGGLASPASSLALLLIPLAFAVAALAVLGVRQTR